MSKGKQGKPSKPKKVIPNSEKNNTNAENHLTPAVKSTDKTEKITEEASKIKENENIITSMSFIERIKDWQSLLTSGIAALLIIFSTEVNLARYSYLLGKFSYWNISKNNITIFDNGWGGFFLAISFFLIVFIVSVFYYEWDAGEDEITDNEFSVIEKKVFGRITLATVTFLLTSSILNIFFGEVVLSPLIIGVPLFFLLILILIEKYIYEKDTVLKVIILFSLLWVAHKIFKIGRSYATINNMLKLLIISALMFTGYFFLEMYMCKTDDKISKKFDWKSALRIFFNSLLVSFFLVVVYTFSLLLSFLWGLYLQKGSFSTPKPLFPVFFESLGESMFLEFGVLYPVLFIAFFLFINYGVRWSTKNILQWFDICIEDHLPKISKEKKWQGFLALSITVPFIVFFSSYTMGYLDTARQKEFLLIQHPASISDSAPDWIFLHEDKDFYIVAEYDDYIVAKTPSSSEKTVVTIYNEVQTIIPKTNVTVYKKSFDDVNRQKGAKLGSLS